MHLSLVLLSLFTFTDVVPPTNCTGQHPVVVETSPIALPGVDTENWVAMGSGGLTNLQSSVGSYAFMAIVNPKTRKGYVAGWLTDEWASGSVHYDSKGLVFRAEYGRIKTGDSVAALKDTYVIGEFDDCRLGLEAYADEVARHYGIKLPKQMAGFCTWYSDKGGFTTDTSKFERGACSEVQSKEFMDKVVELGLGKWGFDYYQIDDTWQDGITFPGPAKIFCRVDPKGPYPSGMKSTADYVNKCGAVAGIWYMPFSGEMKDPWWQDKTDYFVKCAEDGPATKRVHKRVKGKPYDTPFGACALDMSNPRVIEYVKDIAKRITCDWGYRLIKFDGMYTGMAVDLGYGEWYEKDDFGNQDFYDKSVSNVQAFRRGIQAMREGCAEGTQLLACNVKQHARGIAASYGLVEMLRIGGDNGPLDYKAERYMAGPRDGSPRYFLNGRVWYNDPDPVYVRNSVSLERARLFASWTSIGGLLYNFSDWLPYLSEERVDVLKRTMAPHGKPKQVRPIDYFERTVHNVWKLTDGDRAVYGVFNWNTNAALKVDYDAKYADLDANKTYVGFDYWENKFLGKIKGRFQTEVKADACQIISVREFDGTKPVVVSTSRHVASPIFEVQKEEWDDKKCRLSGASKAIVGEKYELRIVVPSGMECVKVNEGEFVQNGDELRVSVVPSTSNYSWRVSFKRR